MAACSTVEGDTEAKIIASVGEVHLYDYETQDLLDAEGNLDSNRLKTFVNSWIREQLIIQKATSFLPESKQNFEEKITDYRNSLLIYAFEKELLDKTGDTVVSEQQIQDYYDLHQNEFKLRKPLIKSRMVITSSSLEDLKEIKRWIKSDDENEEQELADFCLQSSYFSELNDSLWQYLTTASSKLPSAERSKIRDDKAKQLYTFRDSTYEYLLYVKEIMGVGNPAPLQFEREKIKNILLLQRKKTILNRYYQDLWANAEKEKEFEISLNNE